MAQLTSTMNAFTVLRPRAERRGTKQKARRSHVGVESDTSQNTTHPRCVVCTVRVSIVGDVVEPATGGDRTGAFRYHHAAPQEPVGGSAPANLYRASLW